MTIGKNKQLISKGMLLKALILVSLIIILIFYFKAFFTVGAYFNDEFLTKEVKSTDIHYIDKSKNGSIQIIVKGLIDKKSDVDVIYNLPNNINRQYTVSFTGLNSRGLDDIAIKDKDGNILFEGEYRKDRSFMLDKNGDLVLGNIGTRIIRNGETTYSADYEPSLKNIADFASSSNETIRGEYRYLIFAILLIALTLIDIKFPLFFFKLRNFLEVKDPEPSDFYLTMQRVSWVVYPIIAIIFLIVAI